MMVEYVTVYKDSLLSTRRLSGFDEKISAKAREYIFHNLIWLMLLSGEKPGVA